MRKKWMGILPMFVVIALSACNQGRVKEDAAEADIQELDTCCQDTLSPVEEEIEEAEDRLDRSFDDFLFAFTHSIKLFYQRIDYPLLHETSDGTVVEVRTRNFHREFQFLGNDFFTVLYGDASQIEEHQEDSLVQIERINLEEQEVRVYNFQKKDGVWKLTSMCDSDFSSTGFEDFLVFYSSFSSDTIFQYRHIAQPLRLSIMDPEDDEEFIEGTIDAGQWSSFCPDVPCGTISNIRYGQAYNNRQMVMMKCGSSNGLQELFTFQRHGDSWKLVSYEN